MSLDENGVFRFWKAIIPKIKTLISNSTVSCVRRIPAEVVSVDNASHYATVRFPSSSNSTQQSNLMNCTGIDLRVGDSVWVDYAYSLDNAYISIVNNGKPWGW